MTSNPEDHLCSLGVAQLRGGYLSGEFTLVDVVEATLSRIRSHDPVVNSYITVLEEEARGRALTLTEGLESGEVMGPLFGIPISVKDNIDVAGTRTTAASRVRLESPPADTHSWIVGALESAGAIVVGKSNLSEFAFGDSDPDGPFGVVQNPRRIGLRAGTTSSGAAASVAAGFAVLGIGTDTAGSIRHPANACGLVSLKPTFGRLSTEGVVPNSPRLDTIGLIGREVRDLETALHAVSTSKTLAADAQVRVGWLSDMGLAMAHPRYQESVTSLRSELARSAGSLGEVEIPLGRFDYAASVLRDISHVDLCLFHERYEPMRELYAQSFVERVAYGRTVSGIDYARALAAKEEFAEEFEPVFAEFDVLVMPGCLYPAQPHDALTVSGPEGDLPLRLVNGRFDRFASLLGAPTLTVPIGDIDGLPIGVQLVSRPDGEELLFRIGEVIEQTRGTALAQFGIGIR